MTTAKLDAPVTLTAKQRAVLAKFLECLEANEGPDTIIPSSMAGDPTDLVEAFNAIDGGARDPGDYMPDGE